MSGDVHVRICERLGVKLPRATRLVVGFDSKADAQEMLLALKARLANFGRTLHEDKTRLIEFGRFAAVSRQRRGERRPETVMRHCAI
ncbi:nucleoid DNA-binding protein [Bradyrhizobium sp. USDA 4524]|uniref:hypothetical protein n=1 Tax=unclassified Bradyrhizobium TaxID=2631580 RepID=UPI0020A0DAD0|nr:MULTISPECIES: hypothetical protein [unclassified Bradyrhizobium]MCP1838779.1 nucleoid DNA-binding protein [Bradyrhizobium sp. USDA 4538]MCP1899345.1 nucleoid DNA-binding protein [Bradyrhizobium sp. USDA 4537]MCP1986543.1 nucleoid DNA-binding protein [Bradyrhizobium sp. USDA 4539]